MPNLEVVGTSYTVTFESNGGSSVSSQTVPENDLAAEPVDPTRSGYTFEGWFTDDTTFNNAFDFETATITEDLTLYAYWLEIPVLVEELLYSYDFINGGSSNNNAYANTNLTTDISYATDNPSGTSGTTSWTANYANLSLTSGTRLGGKLTSTEYGSPSASIETNFFISKYNYTS